MSPRTVRRLRLRYQRDGYDGLVDRRRRVPSPRRMPVAELSASCSSTGSAIKASNQLGVATWCPPCAGALNSCRALDRWCRRPGRLKQAGRKPLVPSVTGLN